MPNCSLGVVGNEIGSALAMQVEGLFELTESVLLHWYEANWR